ncbi:MAG: hypothetical protein JW934_05625 [Anaerolineae bacterium]|nr:hypothetical protein [Anaerolineae bacterium]
MGELTTSSQMHDPAIDSAWGVPLNIFYCAQCKSAHIAPQDVALAACPSCLHETLSLGSMSADPSAAAPSAQGRREPPELVVPFEIGARRAEESLQAWVKGSWLKPAELRVDLLRERLRRYFLPLWLVDTDIEATWQAEMGYDYQAASYREHYQGGGWVSQQVTETRARWEGRVGMLNRHYDNVAVPALEAHDRWMSRLGGYDFRSRKLYSAQMIAGSVVRTPDYAPDAAWMDAETALNHAAARECLQAAEADHIRNWGMNATFSHLNWTQMLVPAYVTWYREGDRAYPVWLNGQSGHVYGLKLMSMTKAWIIAAVIGVLAVLCFLLGVVLTLIGVGVLLILLSLLLGLLAFIPPIWVWMRNNQARQQAQAS